MSRISYSQIPSVSESFNNSIKCYMTGPQEKPDFNKPIDAFEIPGHTCHQKIPDNPLQWVIGLPFRQMDGMARMSL